MISRIAFTPISTIPNPIYYLSHYNFSAEMKCLPLLVLTLAVVAKTAPVPDGITDVKAELAEMMKGMVRS